VAETESSYEKLLDAFVHAPIGFAMYARDTAPSFLKLFVARGRAELNKQKRQVDDQVTKARTMGRFAVSYGTPEVRRRVEQHVDKARDLAGSVVSGFSALVAEPAGPGAAPRSTSDLVAAADAAAPDSASAARPDPAGAREEAGRAASVDPGPSVTTLPIPEYDELSASQVVERLDGLDASALDAISSYEAAHRGRRTILGKIEQLIP